MAPIWFRPWWVSSDSSLFLLFVQKAWSFGSHHGQVLQMATWEKFLFLFEKSLHLDLVYEAFMLLLKYSFLNALKVFIFSCDLCVVAVLLVWWKEICLSWFVLFKFCSSFNMIFLLLKSFSFYTHNMTLMRLWTFLNIKVWKVCFLDLKK